MSLTAHFLTAASAENEPSVWFVAVLGITVVMLGLTCIILLCTLTGFICSRLLDESSEKTAVSPPSTPASSAPAPAPIPNRGELVAAISAAIAEDLGTDVSAIRIHSVRNLTAAPVSIPNRGELVAAITAAIAEDLGTDVSAIRIHSVRQIG